MSSDYPFLFMFPLIPVVPEKPKGIPVCPNCMKLNITFIHSEVNQHLNS